MFVAVAVADAVAVAVAVVQLYCRCCLLLSVLSCFKPTAMPNRRVDFKIFILALVIVEQHKHERHL